MIDFRKISLVLLFMLSVIMGVAQKNVYNIIPAPLELKAEKGTFTFNKTVLYFLPNALADDNTFAILATKLNQSAGISLQRTNDIAKATIVCKLNNSLPNDESYKLNIGSSKIEIEARTSKGVFYATQSMRQLLPAELESSTKINNKTWSMPCCKISDTPFFKYRGMHLDVCRNFSTKEEVMRYIDQLALLKINTFHWHLTDDQGWRIEIKKYPRLTEIGGFRNRTVNGHYNTVPRTWDNTRVGGFYTQEDIKEVVAYATTRYVDILPEIELPGHAVAALTAYPQYSCSGGPFEVEGLWGVFNDVYCTREETFGFLEDILSEVMDLFPHQYIHIGGDECPKIRWQRCHACQERMKAEGLNNEEELQSYFIKRIGQFVNGKGKKFIGWDEILEGGLAPDATVMSWRGISGGIAAAQQGHDVVMSPPAMYLDYYQSKLPSEPLAIGAYSPIDNCYNFNPIPSELTPAQTKHILGVQANVWTEYMRTPEHREYMIFPRIAALAETAWLPQGKKDFNSFKIRLLSLLERYDVMGINYSRAIFNVKDKIVPENGKMYLKLETDIPDIQIYYTTDGSEPTLSSMLYKEPILLGEKAMIIKAVPVKNGEVLSPPFSQEFIANKLTGQQIKLDKAPSEKYKGDGAYTLVDCMLGRYPIIGSQWLGFLGEDVNVDINFDKPTDIKSLTVGSTHQIGQWIYAPQSVSFFISKDGVSFVKTGQKLHNEMLKSDSKAKLEINESGVKAVRLEVKNYGEIPQGAQGGGHRAWLFLDEIIVE